MVPPSLASGYMPSNMTSGNGSAHGSRSPRDHASDDRRPQSPTGPNGGPYPYFDSQIRDAEYLALQVLKDADKAKNGATIDQEALDMDPLANLPSKVLKKMKKGGHTADNATSVPKNPAEERAKKQADEFLDNLAAKWIAEGRIVPDATGKLVLATPQPMPPGEMMANVAGRGKKVRAVQHMPTLTEAKDQPVEGQAGSTSASIKPIDDQTKTAETKGKMAETEGKQVESQDGSSAAKETPVEDETESQETKYIIAKEPEYSAEVVALFKGEPVPIVSRKAKRKTAAEMIEETEKNVGGQSGTKEPKGL